MTKIKVSRQHEICMGHRVVGHEGKCRHLHGHNYTFVFYCESVAPEGEDDGVGNLDDIGRVVDFSVIKTTLCQWLEDNWDHHTILDADDPMLGILTKADPTVIAVPFNPTAENIGAYLLRSVAPDVLPDNIRLTSVTVQETAKCCAHVSED